TNNGNIDLGPGLQLRNTIGALANNGTINLNGGAIAGTGLLANNPAGVIAGRGTLSLPFNASTNNGALVVGDGVLNVISAFTNAGVIQLTGPTSSILAPAITNTGTIQGADI